MSTIQSKGGSSLMDARNDSFEAKDAVKYVYCILDEISSHITKMNDNPDVGMLPLLTRVELAFAYHHYQLNQSLKGHSMQKFSTWCLHRLIWIGCRPYFTYHVNSVIAIIGKLLAMLERSHLNVYLTQIRRMLDMFRATLINLDERGRDESAPQLPPIKLDQFRLSECQINVEIENQTCSFALSHFPVVLRNKREAHRLLAIVSSIIPDFLSGLQVYFSPLVALVKQLLPVSIKLGDLNCKQRALVVLHSIASLELTSSSSSTSDLTYFTNGLFYALQSVATTTHRSGKRLVTGQLQIDNELITALHSSTAECLVWLASRQASVSKTDQCRLVSQAYQLFTTTFIRSLAWSNTSLGYNKLLDALLTFLLAYVTSSERASSIVFTPDSRGANPFHWFTTVEPSPLSATDVGELDDIEDKMDRLFHKGIQTLSTSLVDSFLSELSMPWSASVKGYTIIRYSRLLRALLRLDRSELVIRKTTSLSIYLAKSISDTLPSLNSFIGAAAAKSIDTTGYASIQIELYYTIRLLSTCFTALRELNESELPDQATIGALRSWISELYTSSDCQTDKLTTGESKLLSFLAPSLICLSSLIGLWLVETGNELADSVGPWLATKVIQPILSRGYRFDVEKQTVGCHAVNDIDNNHDNGDEHRSLVDSHCPLLTVLRHSSSDSDQTATNQLCRSVLQSCLCRLRDPGVKSSEIALMVNLSACLFCQSVGCGRASSLYCLASTKSPPTTSCDPYSFDDHFSLLNRLVDGVSLDLASDAIVDLSLHLAHHVSWDIASQSQIEQFLNLVQSHLPFFPVAAVRGIYSSLGRRLASSSDNSSKWISLHTGLDLMLTGVNSPSRQHGPNAGLSGSAFDEYLIVQCAELTLTAASLFLLSSSMTTSANSNTPVMAGTNNTESPSTSYEELLTSGLTNLCRLGLKHQYAHASFGSVHFEINRIIATLGLPNSHVLRMCRESIAKIIVDNVDHSIGQLTSSLSRLFRLDITSLFKEIITPLFIALVIRGNQESHIRIRQLVADVPYVNANQDYLSKVVQLCVLPDTLVHIFTRTPKEEQDVHLAFLESHLDLPIERIACLNDVARLMHQFILRLFPSRVGACMGLKWIACRVLPARRRRLGLDRSQQPVDNVAGSTKGPALAEFLSSFVCGILAFFDSTLLDDDTMLDHRWTALRSLVVLIQLLGSGHVTRMRAKFIATLNLELDALIELLPDLGATLVGLLPDCPDEVMDLMHYLFLEKRRIKSPMIDSFDVDRLLSGWLDAFKHSSRSVRRLALASEVGSTSDSVDAYASLIGSHLWPIGDRLLALPSSTSSISSPSRRGGGTSSSSSPLLLTDLISSLLDGLGRDTDRAMRLLYSQWFGQLGAIDPSRCYPSSRVTRTSGSQLTFVTSRTFSTEVLCELAKIYLRAASPKQLDSAALAIQELLNYLNVNDQVIASTSSKQQPNNNLLTEADSSDASPMMPFLTGVTLWRSLPEHLWDLFTPLISSKYVVEAFTDWTTLRWPLITSQNELTYENWIRLWAGALGDRVSSTHVSKLFQFCEPTVKADVGFARQMLEHASLQVLIDGNTASVDELRTEVLAVLGEASQNNATDSSNYPVIGDLIMTSMSCKTDSSSDTDHSSGHLISWASLAVQTVFSLLDYLRSWIRSQPSYTTDLLNSSPLGGSASGTDKKPVLDPSIQRVLTFLNDIPHLLQAKASLHCGALARAILHFEAAYCSSSQSMPTSSLGQAIYVTGSAFACSSSTFLTKHVTNLRALTTGGSSVESQSQQTLIVMDGLLNTYAALRESDGLAGVLALARSTASDRSASTSNHRRTAIRNTPLVTSSASSTDSSLPLLQALELENEGQLDTAGSTYEHFLAMTPSSSASTIDSSHHTLMLHAGLLRCALSDPARLHGLSERAGKLMRHSEATSSPDSRWFNRLNACRVEAAWRLADWPTLDETTSLEPNTSWSVGLGKLFLAIHEKRSSTWRSIMTSLRLDQVDELSAAALEGPGGYTRAYETIGRLASLADVELIVSLGEVITNRLSEEIGYDEDQLTHQFVLPDRNGRDNAALVRDLDEFKSRVDVLSTLLESRCKLSRPTFHTLEPCLAVQHASLHHAWNELIQVRRRWLNRANTIIVRGNTDLLSTSLDSLIDQFNAMLGQNWLRRAQLARKSGQYMAAYTCVLRAESFGARDALVERAKHLWQTDRQEAALACLDKGIPDLFKFVSMVGQNLTLTKPPNMRRESPGDLQAGQQALLTRARYCEEASRFDFDTTRRMYEDVCSVNRGCEEAHFRLARYVERARSHATEAKQCDALLKVALTHYGQALTCGSQFIYQCMPRLLTLWLDFGTQCVRQQQTSSSVDARRGGGNMRGVDQSTAVERNRTFKEVQQIMHQNITQIPVYHFYIALEQLLSRICHESPTIVTDIVELVVRVLVAYPLQTIWSLMPLNDSNIRQRREKCQMIFAAAKSKANLTKFIHDMSTLCGHLRTICGLFMTAERRDMRKFSLSQSIRPLTRLVESNDFSRILIPIHRQLVPSLLPPQPSLDQIQGHQPFLTSSGSSSGLACLAKLDDIVEILGSQTRPKKMTWVGSDGRRYVIVAKPNDDLRKDSRLMEVNGMINKFLAREPETSRRSLQIRTYAVIPLSEKGGLIEWVDHTEPFRSILTRFYADAGCPINWANMSRVAPVIDDPLPVKRDKFLNKWLPMFPLIFYRWFLATFPNPSAWYSARECYARTLAVMSMVGYVLGLGDRHTENILFDSTTGGVVHVDFSCVFNNGLTLPWPERVPFRLTRNLVHALGPTGYEGVYRRCCVAVMRLLRDELEPILAVFRPMYFDALVEQDVTAPGSTTAGSNVRSRPTGGGTDQSNSSTSDRVTQAATEKLTSMQARLHGKITESGGGDDAFSRILPMSASGQVDALIKEATDVDQLCQMYKGWMPFL